MLTYDRMLLDATAADLERTLNEAAAAANHGFRSRLLTLTAKELCSFHTLLTRSLHSGKVSVWELATGSTRRTASPVGQAGRSRSQFPRQRGPTGPGSFRWPGPLRGPCPNGPCPSGPP